MWGTTGPCFGETPPAETGACKDCPRSRPLPPPRGAPRRRLKRGAEPLHDPHTSAGPEPPRPKPSPR